MRDSTTVFVSYSSADRMRVAGLVPLLEALGHTVFFDRRAIKAGQKWRDRIETSLAEASAMIVFWTRNAQRSKWVRHEYERFVVLHPEDTLTAVLGDETPPAPLLAERQATDFAPLVNELLAMQRRLKGDGLKHDAIQEALLIRLREAGIELDEKNQRKLMRLFVPAGLAGLIAAPAVTLGNLVNTGTNAVATLSAAQVAVVAAAAVGGAVVCNVAHDPAAPVEAAADPAPGGLHRGSTSGPTDGTLDGLIDPVTPPGGAADPVDPGAPPDGGADVPVDGVHPAGVNRDAVVDCGAIDCDCNGIEGGLLTGPWREVCRNQEAGLREQCQQAGVMPTSACQMSGPNTNPPQ